MGVIQQPVAYLTPEDANDYFATRLNSESWFNASYPDQNAALIRATRAIDALAFEGVKSSDYFNTVLKQVTVYAPVVAPITLPPADYPSEQPLEWPRDGKTEIPQDIYYACCECAIAFLDGVDMGTEMDLIGTQAMRFADVSTSYMAGFYNEWIRAGIPSAEAWQFLKPYLHDPMQIRAKRT